MKINSKFFILLGLCLLLDLADCELGCDQLASLSSFKSIVQFSTNGQSYYIEETKQNDIGKLLIKHGREVQKIYYREKSKFILFETNKNKCTEYTYENGKFVPEFDQRLYAYEIDNKSYLGPSAIFQQFTKEKTEWTQTNTVQRKIECITCQTNLQPEIKFADLTGVQIRFSVRENNGQLEPVRLEINGSGTDNVQKIYVYDYFVFETLTENLALESSRIDRYYNDSILDLPLNGCSKAKMLGNLEFTLYIPQILRLHLNKFNKTDDTKAQKMMAIIYDHKNQLIRVDNLEANYYEIADLNLKNLFHFKNNLQCTPLYYQENFSKNIMAAKAFVNEIYALQNQKFYHLGQMIIEGNIIAQVFEWSVIIEGQENNKNVTTLFTKEMNFTTVSDEANDEYRKKLRLGLLKMMSSLYNETNAQKGYELEQEFIYNIEDYGEMIYDENYRSIFDLRSCIENFRDKAHIALEADFDTNPDKEKISNDRLLEEQENVKTQMAKSILESFTISNPIQSIQFVQYHVSNQRLQVQVELINTNSYIDSFIEYEDGEYTKNAFAGTLNECAFESYDELNTYAGFRYCSVLDKIQKGTCYLVDNQETALFQKPKKNSSKVKKSDIPPGDKSSDDQPDQRPICVLMKKSMQNISIPIVRNLWNLKQYVKDKKFKVVFNNTFETKCKDDEETQKELVLTFNAVTFQPNEQLFPVEREANNFEIISTNNELDVNYVTDELISTNASIQSLNDCYFRCLHSKDGVCHSFAFCYDTKTTISRCQLSKLHFDDLIENWQDDENFNQISDSTGDEFSKYLKESLGCKVYNFEFRNFFKSNDERRIGELHASDTFTDYTLDECIGQCYRHTKHNKTAGDETVCRAVEYCLADVKVNENELDRKSFCRLTSLETRDLPMRERRKRSKCKLYDWNYMIDYHQINRHQMRKASKLSRPATREQCAIRCSTEPYCKNFEFCWLPTYDNDESDLLGICTYESMEQDYVNVRMQLSQTDTKCSIHRKNDGTLMHHEIILDSNSTVSKFRMKIINTRNEDEVLSDTFWKLNGSLFVSAIFIVLTLILTYKKFYNRYRNDPQQAYQSFIRNTFSNTFNKNRYECQTHT